jgi:serine/threonine protein kinase
MAKTYADRWEIIESLNEGGQAIVYRVRDLLGEYDVCVLKRLKKMDRLHRFRDEVEAIRAVKHNNVIRMFDANLDNDPPYIVMELCEPGELTAELLAPLSVTERLTLFGRICAAVAHAHRKGVIHRDIKPPNILLRGTWEVPVVTDFGICIITDSGAERMTEVQEQVGARFYMAPELADGRHEDITPACDVYSLGKLLYWILSSRIFDREKHGHPTWDLRTDATSGAIYDVYDSVFSKAIVEDPIKRFKDASELEDAVNKILEKIDNDGRYLDANVPSSCLFCGAGKYQKSAVLPRITKRPTPRGQEVDHYEVDYSNNFGITVPSLTSLPQGNISQSLYKRYLILKCDNCGNVQTFHFEGPESSWRNTMPDVN